MSLVSFLALFPDIAKREMRTMLLNRGDGVPEEYGFLEHYCVDKGCDCRRVEVFVLSATKGHVASISHAFEPPKPGSIHESDGQTFLDPMNKQTSESHEMLGLFVNEVLTKEYRERLDRHYRMVKDAIADPDHPVHAVLKRGEIEAPVARPRPSVRLVKGGPNDRCHCGSGKKYKRCCMSEDAALPTKTSLSQDGAPPLDLPPGVRIVERNGMRVATTLPDDKLDEAAACLAKFQEQKRRGQGPAQQIADFAKPLLDEAGDDPDALQNAFSLGGFFWNLAMVKDEKVREEGLQLLLARAKTDADRDHIRDLAKRMMSRHEEMFPEKHG